MKFRGFGKKLLMTDYIIAVVLMAVIIYCAFYNANYVTNNTNASTYPIDLTALTVLISCWIGQLGISSTAYYIITKSEHKVQLPMQLVKEMPTELQEKCDMTQIITTVLNNTDN